MNIVLDVLTNLSIIIIICIILIDVYICNNIDGLSCKKMYMILTLVLFFPILIITKHGNIFICVLTQCIYCFAAGASLYDISYDEKTNKEIKEKDFFRYCISNFALFTYCIEGICCVLFRIKLEKEYLISIFNKIKSMHYKEIFLELIKNNWFQGIFVGIISTVVGGLILNKIISHKTKNKDESKDKKYG